jgi:hypothetical protein
VNIISIKNTLSLLSAHLSPLFPSLAPHPQFSLSPSSNPNRRKRKLSGRARDPGEEDHLRRPLPPAPQLYRLQLLGARGPEPRRRPPNPQAATLRRRAPIRLHAHRPTLPPPELLQGPLPRGDPLPNLEFERHPKIGGG